MKPEGRVRLVLDELYLARRAAIELIRDASPETTERINHAFASEVIVLIVYSGASCEAECLHLDEAGETDMASLIRGLLPI